MSNNKIQYHSTADFYDGILELTKRGLTFDANLASLSITLTGGY